MPGSPVRESLREVLLAHGPARIDHPHDCLILDDALLDDALRASGAGFSAGDILRDMPHLFSRASVFIDRDTAERMRAVVSAVERVFALPAYRRSVGAVDDVSQRGAFLGFDFHLSAQGPQLIEINTNAGGGLLNALLRKSQRSCCHDVLGLLAPEPPDAAQAFVEMLQREWASARGTQPLRSIAIADDAPETQFLYPEFVLFQRLFEAHGMEARVVDARQLSLRDGRLHAGEFAIDLVYNRCTDFYFARPEHAVLAQAFADRSAVITPHPVAHALYADKRRLCLLSDDEALRAIGATHADRALLVQHVPHTVEVSGEPADALWHRRKGLFFKPQHGYGSKAAYRGDKLTRRTFEQQVLANPYVAQRLVPPSSRIVRVGHEDPRALKVDVRNFAYAGHVQLVCARLYDGQTTNFRTQGGGFAPVFETVA